MGNNAAPPDTKAAQNTLMQTAQAGVANPFANQGWGKDANGNPVQFSGFSGPLAGAVGNLSGQAANALSNPFDPSQYGQILNGDQARQQAINAAYGSATQQLNPQFDNAQERLNAQLANQGLSPGSAAAQAAQSQLGMQENNAYNQALNSAIGQGTAAGNSVFQNNLAAQQAGIQNALLSRSLPLQEMQQLQAFLPQANPSMLFQGALASTNQGNTGFQQRMQTAQQENQNESDAASGILGGIGTVAGAAAMMF